MQAPISILQHLVARLREQLWWKPLLFGVLSVLAVTAAKLGDVAFDASWAPEIGAETLMATLKVMASSMLVVATFAVGSMVSAYASASTTATPRSFPLIVADDLSQNALSTFLAAFVYSVIALVAVHQETFGVFGRFLLFSLTMVMFAVVVLILIAWVDRIARLGRLGTVVARIEHNTGDVLERFAKMPHLGAWPLPDDAPSHGREVFAHKPAYVQLIDLQKLQEWAERHDARVDVLAIPGALASAARPLLRVHDHATEADDDRLREAVRLGDRRTFDSDPRYGLTVLSEIASRALSPGVNDPGSAIDVVAAQLRLLDRWGRTLQQDRDSEDGHLQFDRLRVPCLSADDLIEDAFSGIARDGAGCIEVALRLQRALLALAMSPHRELCESALHQSRQALERAERALDHAPDLQRVRAAAADVEQAAVGARS